MSEMNQYSRRLFCSVSAGLVLSGGIPLVGAGDLRAACMTEVNGGTEVNTGYRLSQSGCGRATGYAETNKIISAEGKTHVAWLDSVSEGFRVRVRTLDEGRNEWSKTVTLGEGYDNHGGPALTIDGAGYLHVVYYPHHHAFRYRRSVRPHDASAWTEEVKFGERLTYPTMLCGLDNTLYLTARRSYQGKRRPWEVELWKKPYGKAWEKTSAILRSRYTGYSHFQESIAWGEDGKTLHLGCRFHEKSDGKGYGRIQTVGYLRSEDYGKTWITSAGQKVKLPVTADKADQLENGGVDYGRELRCGAMSVDMNGVPHIAYSVVEKGAGKTIIARPRDGGGWEKRVMNAHLPEKLQKHDLVMPGGVVFHGSNDMVVVGTLKDIKTGKLGWGHPSNEVVMLRSKDGGKTFAYKMITKPSTENPHWLPSIERLTGHNQFGKQIGLMYTSGGRGKNNKDLVANDVYWVGL